MLVTAFGTGTYGRLDASVRRSGAVTRRNLAALRSAYWLVVISGLVEPFLYLFSIGIGVGKLVGSLPLPDGRMVPYAAFVAPSMLATTGCWPPRYGRWRSPSVSCSGRWPAAPSTAPRSWS